MEFLIMTFVQISNRLLKTQFKNEFKFYYASIQYFFSVNGIHFT